MNNGDNNAFPLTTDAERDSTVQEGLTKREYFAGLAMQGMLANPECFKLLVKQIKQDEHHEFLSLAAVEQADALLAELEKPQS